MAKVTLSRRRTKRRHIREEATINHLVRSVFEKCGFVCFQKCRAVQVADIPHQHAPTAWPKGSAELGFALRNIKPMKCLAGNNEVNRMI